MKISRRQLRILIENAVEGNLQNLEKAAMPIMDLIVGYHNSQKDNRSRFSNQEEERKAFLNTDSFLSKIENQLKKSTNKVDKSSLFAKINELFAKFLREGKIKPLAGTGVNQLDDFLYYLVREFATPKMDEKQRSSYFTKQYTTVGRPRYVSRLKDSKSDEYHRAISDIASSSFPLTVELMNSAT